MVISFDFWRGFKRSYGVYALLILTLTTLGSLSVANDAIAAVKPKQVVLLLHGMNSNGSTWNKLVDNSAGFDGQCTNVRDPKFPTIVIKPNSEGVYCMRFNFGAYDRLSTAPKGLDKKICSEAGGCSGDYSTYDTLGKEIEGVIRRIRTRLGTTAQIVFLGHSRGGIAARAFLQSSTSALKVNVVGLITTGTPHAGSPLGRYYTYMAKKCLPESDHDGLFDTSDCADDWRFINSFAIKDIGGLDLKAPTISFLSEISPVLNVLNAKVTALPKIKFSQLSYDRIKFGCLGGDPIDEESGCGYDIFGSRIRGKPSGDGLNAVLNGRARDLLRGDGIVPVNSQKMSLLKGWNNAVVPYARANRVHIAETEQTLDLAIALRNMYKRLGW
ncbi:esterase/lipase family protein [Crenothrix sp.]|uniref:esterase/lipase family protein n=1 Tax=Crenothrix sp. TaxID=3100433 RepID=UPI00374CC982